MPVLGAERSRALSLGASVLNDARKCCKRVSHGHEGAQSGLHGGWEGSGSEAVLFELRLEERKFEGF